MSNGYNGKSLVAPRAEGQALAMRRALEDAGDDVKPESIGLHECHASGTAVMARVYDSSYRPRGSEFVVNETTAVLTINDNSPGKKSRDGIDDTSINSQDQSSIYGSCGYFVSFVPYINFSCLTQNFLIR